MTRCYYSDGRDEEIVSRRTPDLIYTDLSRYEAYLNLGDNSDFSMTLVRRPVEKDPVVGLRIDHYHHHLWESRYLAHIVGRFFRINILRHIGMQGQEAIG